MKELTLLESNDIDFIYDKIIGLRAIWEKIELNVPAYKLGAASYIDAKKNYNYYQQKAKELNPILYKNFDGLYSKLINAFTAEYKKPCVYSPSLSPPGFHIFLSHPLFQTPIASVHIDLQYQLIDQYLFSIDPSKTFSFTLPIVLPYSGGGLNLWHKDQGIKKYHPYTIGNLVLHSGHQYHQIAACKNLLSTDKRITLQGHGIEETDRVVLYW